MKNRKKFLAVLFLSTVLVMGGCGLGNSAAVTTQSAEQDSVVSQEVQTTADESETKETVNNEAEENMSSSSVTAQSGTLLDTSEMFSDRDLEQEADTSGAQKITLESGSDVTISTEGVYVITGSAKDTTIIVDAEDTAKVQLVLDKVTITNSDAPAIYVKSADKVFITTTDSENSMTVTGTFTADGDTNTDAVIYSKDDLVFNGKGSLNIVSTANGITGKDDIKFTGGSYNIQSTADAIEANDSIRICDGSFTIKTDKDALHSENSDDNSLGYIYISGGSFDIDAKDDGIQATTVLMVDGGSFDISAAEGLEATYVQINNGEIKIEASDDGINATSKSTSFETVIEINGGSININMGSGDTDALDANGNLYINGGTVDITAQFAFDFDGTGQLNGGTVTVNGEAVTEISNSMMMGGGHGGFGGQGFGAEEQNGNGGPGFNAEGQNGDTTRQGFGGKEGFGGKGGRKMQQGTDGNAMPAMPNEDTGNTENSNNGN
jgi:hypothetical protein